MQPAREVERRGVAPLCGLLNGRSAGVGQTQQARHFVERFAGGVIQRGAQPLVAPVAAHQNHLGVAAGDDQHQQRESPSLSI